jgi:hypothetical protein
VSKNRYTEDQKKIRRERARQLKNDALCLERACQVVRSHFYDGRWDTLHLDSGYVSQALEAMAHKLRELQQELR